MSASAALSVAIPTYRREAVLVDSVRALLLLMPPPSEILVLDQTKEHDPPTTAALTGWNSAGLIRWLRLPKPSIPHAMNVGLRVSTGEVVLFLDDDIIPDSALVAAHAAAHERANLVAGLVLQPGEEPVPRKLGERFRFNSTESDWIQEFMGGNFSIKRSAALALGGFDENFVGAAYRFEAEFAHRYVKHYGAIRFEPSARIRHLQAAAGGTRAHGHHLRTAKPAHAVGEYYFLLRARPKSWPWRILGRPIRSICTRHHLRRPWWIPVSLLAEFQGLCLATYLFARGPKHTFSEN